MDNRIRGEISRTWDQVLKHEYTIIEDICKSVGDPCGLVEVGCGSLGLLGRHGDRLLGLHANSLGIDIDRESLSKNRQVRHHVCASCYSLPLKTSSVDIVVCRWLFEHLERPEEALRELARVLRKGGFLYVKTPNLMNYAMVISKLTPTSFHNLFKAAAGEPDNIPTFYRANTRRKLKDLATKSGFAVRRLESYPSSYMYYMFNKELFLMMRGVSRLVGKITDRLHLTIMCVLEKVQDP